MQFKYLLMIALCLLSFAALSKNTIVIAAPHWENQTNPDGTGFYWDVFRAVFSQADVDFEVLSVPWNRAKLLVERQQADVFIAATPDNNPALTFSKYPMDYTITAAVQRLDYAETWEGIRSLEKRRVAFVRGYEYDTFLEINLEKVEVADITYAIGMLSKHRVDFVIDDYATINNSFDTLGFSPLDYKVTILQSDPMYLGLPATERGVWIASIWDEHLPRLIKNGELKPIYEQYGYDRYYQFMVKHFQNKN